MDLQSELQKLLSLPLFPMTLTNPCSTRTQEGVILLHGLCRTATSMSDMEAYLTQEGYIVLNCNYPSRTDSVESLSNKVIGEALANEKLKECERIHFVKYRYHFIYR